MLNVDTAGKAKIVWLASLAVDNHSVRMDSDRVERCVVEAELAGRGNPLPEADLEVTGCTNIDVSTRCVVVDRVQTACGLQGGVAVTSPAFFMIA